MTSDYAQTFFKHDEKDTGKSSDNGGKRGFVRVKHVAVNSGKGRTNSLPSNNRDLERQKSSPVHAKPPPLCFICNSFDSRHFIGDCEMFKSFNCLALGHLVRNCSF